MPYSDMNEPSPRSRNTATTASGSCTVIAGSGFCSFWTIGITMYAISVSPAATMTIPTKASANAHQ